MKKVLVLGLMVTASAFADSSFQYELSTSADLMDQSKNYEAKYVNQDLTETIVKPKFSNPTGEGALYLSANSDFGGVCKLFGLGAYAGDSKLYFNAGSGRSVVIDSAGKFSRFDSNTSYYAINSFACAPIQVRPIPVSNNHSGRSVNDDGSVTIKLPKFMMNGMSLYFSANSNLDGLCKIYGLTSHVLKSELYLNASAGNSVVVDATSHFARYDSNQKYYAINSLMCR